MRLTDILMSEHGVSLYQIAGTYARSKVAKAPERDPTAGVDALPAAGTRCPRRGRASGRPRSAVSPALCR